MLNFLKKYRYIIIANFIIILSYLFIATVPELFGYDDICANVYIFHPEFTFSDTVAWILDRIMTWNSRIGELLYFVTGCFPRWVFFIFSSISIITFLNLVYFYIYGKNTKKHINTLNYFITILILWIVTITIYPAFSETIIWMAGIFNHVVDAAIILIAGIPFRLLFDKYNLFTEKPKLKKYFYILCFLSGFSVENIVPWFLFYILCSSLYNLKFNKNDKNIKWQFWGFLIVIGSFIIMYFLSSTQNRLDLFYQDEFSIITKKSIFTFFLDDYHIFYQFIIPFFIVVLILSLLDKKRITFYKNVGLLVLQSITSFISLVVLVLAPYYSMRATILIYFFYLTLICYSINYILKYKLIKIIILIITIVSIPLWTYQLNLFYKDFNKYNEYRYNYMKSQIKDELLLRKNKIYNIIPYHSNDYSVTNKNLDINLYIKQINNIIQEQNPITIKCTNYDNKYNVFFVNRLISFEGNICTNTYINYYFNMENIEIIIEDDKIR